MPDSRAAAGKKANKGQFPKGRSGNPGGRRAAPKEVKEMLKAATVPAVELLIATVNDRQAKPELRVRCAEVILDRALGKPTQPIEADVSRVVIMGEGNLIE
jgi:hypothetical protein